MYIVRMSSGDFTFITLRNITAYQSNNAYVPNNHVLTMSTNGNAQWTNHLHIDTLTASTITGITIQGDTLSTLQNTFSSIIMEPATYTTATDYTNTGTNTVSSILINIGGTMWKIPIELA